MFWVSFSSLLTVDLLCQACGLVKNLALMVYVTVGSAASPILAILSDLGTENLEVCRTKQSVSYSISATSFHVFTQDLDLIVGKLSISYTQSYKNIC